MPALININVARSDAVFDVIEEEARLMSAVDTTHRPMHGIAAGWALSAVFAIFFLICVAIASLWPTSAFGQGWQTVLATLPGGSLAAFVESFLGLIAIAWLAAIVFAGVYNRMLSQAQSK